MPREEFTSVKVYKRMQNKEFFSDKNVMVCPKNTKMLSKNAYIREKILDSWFVLALIPLLAREESNNS